MTTIVAFDDENQRNRLIDVVVVGGAALFGVIAVVLDIEEQAGDVTALDIGLILAACVSLFGRRRWPIAVVIVICALRATVIAVTGSEIATAIALMIAFYNLTATEQRRWSFAAAIAAALGFTALITTVDSGESFPQELLAELATTLLPATFGEIVRGRAQRLTAAIDAEAQLRVQAERLRIARDLHDVVAHGLTSIAVQSGTAAYNLPGDDPNDPTRVALERINDVGKRSLEELRAMVGVLRSTDAEPGDASDAPLRPTPTDPNDFSDLIDSAAMAEIDLSVDVTGSFPSDTSESTIVAAHRIAQEAITNVARHAGAVHATLTLEHAVESVELRLVNTTSRQEASRLPSTGVGIIGMKERAESIGGSLSASPLAGGGFEVCALLPYRMSER